MGTVRNILGDQGNTDRNFWEQGNSVKVSFIFMSGKLLYFCLGLSDYSDKFPKTFCSSCGMECPSTANLCHQCGQQLNLSQVSNKVASSIDKEKLK